jgi:hypothetical protein
MLFPQYLCTTSRCRRMYIAFAIFLLITAVCSFWFYYVIPIRHGLRVTAVEEQMRDLGISIGGFRAFNGQPPTQDQFYTNALMRPNGFKAITSVTCSLTSPIVCMVKMPFDPFHEPCGEYHFSYWTNGDIWVLRSYGPDKKSDVDIDNLGAFIESNIGFIEDNDYLKWEYHPSNGLKSSGDIIWSSQH